MKTTMRRRTAKIRPRVMARSYHGYLFGMRRWNSALKLRIDMRRAERELLRDRRWASEYLDKRKFEAWAREMFGIEGVTCG